MTVLTSIPNGASNKDIRDTWNNMLTRMVTLEAGASQPVASLTSAVVQAEGNTGSINFGWTETIARNGSTAVITRNWAITPNGTNPADAADFGGAFPSGTLTYAANETQKPINVSVSGDTAIEPAETFLLTVSGGGLNTVTSTGTISNDDSASGFTSGVEEGDSITVANESFASIYTRPAGKTLTVRAQNSRTIRYGDSALATQDDGSNSLIGHVTEDVTTYGGQFVASMIGANDLAASRTAAQYKGDLAIIKAAYAAKGAKFYWSPPLPYDTTPGAHPSYAQFTAARATVIADCRDPAVWINYGHGFFPLGLTSAFAVSDNSALFTGGGGVHPTAAAHSTYLAPNFKGFMDGLFDATRATSTQIYDALWPASETNLATSAEIIRKFVVSGLAPGGIALSGGNALSVTGGAQVWLATDPAQNYASAATGWLYNGDEVCLKLTTSASNSTTTSIDLKIGSETRTLTYQTGAAATPATLASGGFVDFDSQAAAPSVTFPATGLGIIAIAGYLPTAPTVSYKGVTCTLLGGRYDPFRGVFWYGVPVTSLSAGTLAIGGSASVEVWYGTAVGVDPTPVLNPAIHIDNSANPSWSTGSLAVPANGIAVTMMGVFDTATAATVTSGDFVGSDSGKLYNGERYGIAVGKRITPGSITFNLNQYTEKWLATLVFKAAGT